jgi:hypothetical protein
MLATHLPKHVGNTGRLLHMRAFWRLCHCEFMLVANGVDGDFSLARAAVDLEAARAFLRE